MRLYDISQEVFGCTVYPGDPAPEQRALFDMQRGDVYNLTAFCMCAHNGTHIDAPRHFIKDGDTVDAIPLEATVGRALVVRHEGDLLANDALAILARTREASPDGMLRILIKGSAVVTREAADVLAAAGVLLVGVESQSVGPEQSPMAVHLSLLGAHVVLLEGVRLSHVPEGSYLLCAAPLLLGGCEGAPTRAILLEL
jgi:arylformamidase